MRSAMTHHTINSDSSDTMRSAMTQHTKTSDSSQKVGKRKAKKLAPDKAGRPANPEVGARYAAFIRRAG